MRTPAAACALALATAACGARTELEVPSPACTWRVERRVVARAPDWNLRVGAAVATPRGWLLLTSRVEYSGPAPTGMWEDRTAVVALDDAGVAGSPLEVFPVARGSRGGGMIESGAAGGDLARCGSGFALVGANARGTCAFRGTVLGEA